MIIILTFSTASEKHKFEYIYKSYKNLMLHKAYGILRDNALAEDAVSEAFIRLYKNLNKIEDPDSGRSIAFAVTIVKNVSLTMLAKLNRQILEPLEDYQAEDAFNLEHYILGEISAQEITRLVDTLKEDLKAVFLLSFAYHLSHKEIARILKISENNVAVRLYRAKKKLSELLIKEGYVNERK